jgi:antitoxin (DNA-binding transcriptional repressor) of toxin-antitoxin stability system
MYQVTADEAKSRLDELLAAALRGEQVVIAADATHSVQLVPTPIARKRRKAGSAKGLISVAEDFDAPLADFEEYMK